LIVPHYIFACKWISLDLTRWETLKADDLVKTWPHVLGTRQNSRRQLRDVVTRIVGLGRWIKNRF